MSDQSTLTKNEVNTVNGVNVDAIFSTIEAIEKNPAIAAFRFRNSNKWITGGLNRSKISGFYGALQEFEGREFVLDNDEPPVLLSEDRAPNPVEHVLHGLAGCITTTVVYYAAAKGIRIDEMETRFEGDIDLRGLLGIAGARRAGYQQIRVSVKIKADASRDELNELLKLARSRSPVFNTISEPVDIQMNLED